MSHTNSTTNYSLPQFLGTDKPAWLGDINPAFSTIDGAIKTASDNASSANTASTANTTAIGDLSTLTTSSKTNLVGATNEVNSNLGTVATQVGTNTGDIGNIKGDLTSMEICSSTTALWYILQSLLLSLYPYSLRGPVWDFTSVRLVKTLQLQTRRESTLQNISISPPA